MSGSALDHKMETLRCLALLQDGSKRPHCDDRCSYMYACRRYSISRLRSTKRATEVLMACNITWLSGISKPISFARFICALHVSSICMASRCDDATRKFVKFCCKDLRSSRDPGAASTMTWSKISAHDTVPRMSNPRRNPSGRACMIKGRNLHSSSA